MSIDKIRAAMNKAEGAVQAVGGVALLIAEHVPARPTLSRLTLRTRT